MGFLVDPGIGDEGRERILAALPGGNREHFEEVREALAEYLGEVSEGEIAGLTAKARVKVKQDETRQSRARLAAVRDAARALREREGTVQAGRVAARALRDALEALSLADKDRISDAWVRAEPLEALIPADMDRDSDDCRKLAAALLKGADVLFDDVLAGREITPKAFDRGVRTEAVLARLELAARPQKGRPRDDAERLLCWHLAGVWHRATGKLPASSRSGPKRRGQKLTPSPFHRFVRASVEELPAKARPGMMHRLVEEVCKTYRRAHLQQN